MKNTKTVSYDKNYKMSKPTKTLLAMYYSQEQRLILKQLLIDAENHFSLVKKTASIKKVELSKYESSNSSSE